jgi:hypothetical protein
MAGAFVVGRGGTADAHSPKQMKDLLLIAVSLAFFGLTWAYARSLDRL